MSEQIAEARRRVEGLLAADFPAAADVEHALTDGYAHAMAIEREMLALERRMADLAASADELSAARELRTLFPRQRSLDGQLRELRAELASLKRHAEHAGTLGARR